MSKNKTTLAILLGCVWSSPHAQMGSDEDLLLLYGDEEIISIATGTSKPIHLAPSVASVITARDIKAMGARTLDEALEMVPGLHVSYSFNRLNSIYSIRGIHTANNPQVLLLVNGYPVKNLVAGGRPHLFRLPVANISRIEVIRGPGSAVYGADAFSGVINVITKSADEMDGEVLGARVGSFGTREGWAQFGGQQGNWDVAFSLEYTTTDGDDGRRVNADFQTLLDAMSGTAASLAPGVLKTQYDILNTSLDLTNNHWNLWLNGWVLKNAGVGGGAAQALDPVGEQDLDQYIAKLNYSNDDFSEHWGLDTFLAYRRQDEQATFQILPPGTKVGVCSDGNLPPLATGCTSGLPSLVDFSEGLLGNPGGLSTKISFEVAIDYRRFVDHRIRLAIGADHERMEAKETKNFGPGVIDGAVSLIDGTLTDVTGTENIFMPDKSRSVRYLSLQDEWKMAPDWELTGGVRYDHYSGFGGTFNPRLALVWAMDYNLTSKILYGRAFRAPAFDELFNANNPAAVGNPDLRPESIDMLELVFDYRPGFDVQTVFNLYSYQIDDLISLVGTRYSNANNQRGHGLEAEIDWKVNNTIRVYGNLAWQRSKDSNTQETIANAPARQASGTVRWQATALCAFNAQANWVSGRSRTSIDTRKKIDDYTLVDLIARCSTAKTPIEYSLVLKNVFDKDAREPSDGRIPGDYPLEGRSVYLEVIYRFSKY